VHLASDRHHVTFDIDHRRDHVTELSRHYRQFRPRPDVIVIMAQGIKGVAEIAMATHAGMTTDEFDRIVREWPATATHPKTHQPTRRWCTNRCSSSFGTSARRLRDVHRLGRRRGVHARVRRGCLWRAAGERHRLHDQDALEMRDGKPVLQRDAALDFFDDKTGKPVAINKYVGHRPILCVGNSDDDREMLM
jgi:ketosteroid isomerase-like protein